MKIYCPPAATNAKPVSHAWINVANGACCKSLLSTPFVQLCKFLIIAYIIALVTLIVCFNFLTSLTQVIKPLLCVCLYVYV